MGTTEKRSYTDPDTVYPRKDYHAPKPKPQNRVPAGRRIPDQHTVDELLDAGIILHNGHIAGLVEALREARAIIERSARVGGMETVDLRADSRELLAKWKG